MVTTQDSTQELVVRVVLETVEVRIFASRSKVLEACCSLGELVGGRELEKRDKKGKALRCRDDVVCRTEHTVSYTQTHEGSIIIIKNYLH